MAGRKTPTIALVQPSETAEVAFAIVMAHFGRWVPLSEIRRSLGALPPGRPLAYLAERASSWGLGARYSRPTPEALAQLSHPAILRWETRHFVVLEGRDKKGWWINDPKGRRRRVPEAEFAKRLPIEVLELWPTESFAPQGEPTSLRRSLAHILRGTRSAFVACGIAATGLALGNLALAGLLTYFMNYVLVDQLVERIPPFLLAVVVVAIIRSGCTYLRLQHALRLESAAVLRLEGDVLQRVTTLPEWEADVRAPGDVQQRLSMIRSFSTSIIQPLADAPSNIITVLLFGTAITVISPLVAAGVLTMILFGSLVVKFSSPRIYAANSSQERALGLQRATMLSGLGARDWLAESGASHALSTQWLGELAAGRNLAQQTGRLQLLATTARNGGSQIASQVGTLVLGGIGVIEGSVTIGELAALQSLVQWFQAAVTGLQNLIQSLPVMRSNLARVEDILDIPPESPTKTSTTVRPAGDTVVEFSDVGLDTDGILSGALRAGTVTFVEGLSGPAASLLALRLGGGSENAREIAFFEPPSEIRAPLEGVRLLTGNAAVHPGTIRENLSGFDPSIDTRRVWEALDLVGLGGQFRAAQRALDEPVQETKTFESGSEEAGFDLATAILRPPAVAVACGALTKLTPEVGNRALRGLAAAGTAVIVLEPAWTPMEEARRIRPRQRGGERA